MWTKLPDFDNKVLQEILCTHSPDCSLVVDRKALLTIAKDILHKATPTAHGPCKCLVDLKTDNEVLIDKAHRQQVIRDALAFTIHKIGCELSCSGEGDMKATILAVFNTLAKYSWDAKVVLVLAAFALRYGELYLVSKQHASSPVAESMVLLKPLLPDIRDRESIISSLLELVMEVTNCIIELMDLPLQYISHDKPPLFDALNFIPIAVYWAIKCIVACASESIGLIKICHGYLTSIEEAQKILCDLSRTLISIHTDLQKHLVLCRERVGESSHRHYNNLTVSTASGVIQENVGCICCNRPINKILLPDNAHKHCNNLTVSTISGVIQENVGCICSNRPINNILLPDHGHKHCNNLTVSTTSGVIEEKVACICCNRPANKILLPNHAHKHCNNHTVSTTSGVIQEKVDCICCNRSVNKILRPDHAHKLCNNHTVSTTCGAIQEKVDCICCNRPVNTILHPDHAHKHCNNLTVSTSCGAIQEKVDCICCNSPMEKYVTYKCCIE